MSDHTIELVASALLIGTAANAIGYGVALAHGIATDILAWWKRKGSE
jgi:hypothetical protein